MNVATITMEKEQALEKLEAYRRDRHKDTEDLYAECAKAYEALSEGTPLIDLHEAIRAAGFFETMMPKFAVAAADAPEVRFNWDPYKLTATFSVPRKSRRRAVRKNWRDMEVNLGRVHGQKFLNRTTNEWWGRHLEGYALVPMVPADVRPKTGLLKEWHILWEVEAWSDKSLTGAPPRDPFLIKHVAGNLWAVLAEWDLTDLERSVMAGLVQRSQN